MQSLPYQTIEEIENAPVMALFQFFGSYDNVEKRLAELRAEQKTCDACDAPANYAVQSFFGRYHYCCKPHEQAAIDQLLDVDEDASDPVPSCNCKEVAAR